ncbi:MAG: dephospho-CoA kinase [Clostridia bacterium]|nr:dephospho-CoA kinase [Clostridia bacterium]
MKVIGLTGPSGAGKSLVAEILASYGIPVINADEVYHDILSRGDACTEELADAFGENILDAGGLVCRAALADAVFGKPNTPALLHTLNTITHKYVMSEIKKRLQQCRKASNRAAVLDAPLLFEANAHLECDVVIGVLASYQKRLSRILSRDHLTPEAAEKRLAAGKDDDFYRTRCDHILINNDDAAELKKKIEQLLIETGVGID